MLEKIKHIMKKEILIWLNIIKKNLKTGAKNFRKLYDIIQIQSRWPRIE